MRTFRSKTKFLVLARLMGYTIDTNNTAKRWAFVYEEGGDIGGWNPHTQSARLAEDVFEWHSFWVKLGWEQQHTDDLSKEKV